MEKRKRPSRTKESTAKGKKNSRFTKGQQMIMNILLVVCGAGLVFSLIMLFNNASEETKDRNRILNDLSMFLNPEGAAKPGSKEDPYKDVVFPEGILEQMKPFYARNKETVGFLMINGIKNFGYPVVQASNNEKYLRKDLDSKYSREGTVFMDYKVTFDSFGEPENHQNLLMHGHNNKNGLMFAPLVKYNAFESGLSQFKKAPIIDFYTLYKKTSYKICAVVLPNLRWEDGATFDFMSTDFYDKEKFDVFHDEVMSRSVINTGVDFEYGEELITLHTCVYYLNDKGMHLLIIGRELRPGENADNTNTSAATVNNSAVMADTYVDKYGKGVKVSKVKGTKKK